jgi:hypothetical protein
MILMRLAVLIILLLTLSGPVFALSVFKKKEKKIEPKPVYVNSEFKLQSMIDTPWGRSLLELAVYIPYGESFVAIMLQQDELLGPIVADISWLNANAKILPYKVESFQDERLNTLAVDFDPANAYDRIHDDKHFVRKIYYFDRSQILVDTYNKSTHIINLILQKDQQQLSIDLRAEAELYREPNFVIPQIPQNYQATQDNPAIIPQNSQNPRVDSPIPTNFPPVQDPNEEVPWDNIPQLEPNLFDNDSDLEF